MIEVSESSWLTSELFEGSSSIFGSNYLGGTGLNFKDFGHYKNLLKNFSTLKVSSTGALDLKCEYKGIGNGDKFWFADTKIYIILSTLQNDIVKLSCWITLLMPKNLLYNSFLILYIG